MKRIITAIASAAAILLMVTGCGLFSTPIGVGLTDKQIAAIEAAEPGNSLFARGYEPASVHDAITLFKRADGMGPDVVVQNDLVTDLVGDPAYGQDSNLLIEIPVGPWQIFSHLTPQDQAYLLGISPEVMKAWEKNHNDWYCTNNIVLPGSDPALPPLKVSACPGGHY